jgi:hypothetical protein
MLFRFFIWVSEYPLKADESAMGAIMQMNFFIGVLGNPPRADQSALGAINRPLRLSRLLC